MKTAPIFSKIDIFIQCFILFFAIPSAISTVFQVENGFLYMICLFFLGVWQLSSALLHTIFTSDRFRGFYLLASLAYCLVLFTGTSIFANLQLNEHLELTLALFFFFIVPGVAGIFYFIYSILAEATPIPKNDFV